MLSEDEIRNLRVAAAIVGVGISDFVRPLIFERVEELIEQRGFRNGLPRRAASAPAKSPQK